MRTHPMTEKSLMNVRQPLWYTAVLSNNGVGNMEWNKK